MDESVGQRCGSCKRMKPSADFSPSYRGKPGTWCRGCFADHAAGCREPTVHEPLICYGCDQPYIPRVRRGDSKFCSRKCKEATRRAVWAAENEAKKPAIRLCGSCSQPFPRRMRADAKYCSAACRDTSLHGLRYARTRGSEAVERFSLDEIFERDAGICHLCHQPCPREQASMDHIIPVSPPHHGPHTRANVRLAHAGCNSRKGRKLLAELPWYQPPKEAAC